MHPKQTAVAIAAGALVAIISACGNSETATRSSESPASATAASTPNGASADVQAHNDADVAFAQGMIPHHQQAVEMSDMVLTKKGVDPRVASLAEEIKAAQAPEIETMRSWLSDWGVAVTPPMSSGTQGHDMSGHESMPGMGVDGMMTAADMTALDEARGPDASRLFLTQMIEHHRGAISMAQSEIDGGRYAAAVSMARTIASSQ